MSPSSKNQRPEKKQEKQKKDAVITIRDLSVTYFPGRSNEVKALQNINLEIERGEYIIFFGPSGCGKSTLLYSIAGLERNTEGDIIVEGANLATMNAHDVEIYHQTTVGMIFQSYYLIPSLSVADNVAMPQVALSGAKADRTKKAVELLEKFGVGAQAHKLPTELSGGQQQRVAICRSLMNDSNILVADEPVGNLDSKSTKDVMDLLRYLNDEQKKTVILVTHDPSHLHHAHRIYYLRDGMITGMKKNTEEERKAPAAEITGTLSPETVASSLQHWVRTFSEKAPAAKIARAVAESQHILAESVMGMTVDELLQIELKIQEILDTGAQEHQTIYAFLTAPAASGGVGMQKKRAKEMASLMQSLARKVHHLREEYGSDRKAPAPEDDTPLSVHETRDIRKQLLDSIGLTLRSLKDVETMDAIIQKHLEGKIDRKVVQKEFMKARSQGGLGLGSRQARNAAHRLEPLILFKPADIPSESIDPSQTHETQ